MSRRVFHSPSTAARLVGVTAERIRQLCDEGRVKCLKDVAGRRFIPDVEIRKLIADRAKVSATKEARLDPRSRRTARQRDWMHTESANARPLCSERTE